MPFFYKHIVPTGLKSGEAFFYKHIAETPKQINPTGLKRNATYPKRQAPAGRNVYRNATYPKR